MSVSEHAVQIDAGEGTTLDGNLAVPEGASGLVLFAHGSGSSRHSPRNNAVAESLQERGLATLLFDLLTEEEDAVRETRFDIELLVQRLVDATDWTDRRPEIQGLDVGYFGASTGAAAALRAAVQRDVGAVVSRGGRVDMAGPALPDVEAPCLFIVGGDDEPVLEYNRESFERLTCERELAVVEGAGHLFEGPGELERVAELAGDWFEDHLG